MVYDWEDKRETCHRLYVEEDRSVTEVVSYFKEQMEFVPSRRAFQCQFERWGFPSKPKAATVLGPEFVARVKDLWEKNTRQKDMTVILAEEGYVVNERALMRLRIKHGFIFRGPSGAISESVSRTQAPPNDDAPPVERAPPIGMARSERERKRKERMAEIQATSDQALQSRKRRRRTTDRDGMPADPPGPPRFPSETTIGQSQAYLQLDTAHYKQARDEFYSICNQHSIVKKTLCGPDVWQMAKNELIAGDSHLSRLFQNANASTLAPLDLALDVICMDVTKSIRVHTKAMTLAEAKNALNINPAEAREMRQRLIDILADNSFVTKQVSDSWEHLRDQWLDEYGLMQRFPAEEGPEREVGLRAVRMLCRDIMKRWRDAQTKRDPNKTHKDRQAAAGDTNGTSARATRTSNQSTNAAPTRSSAQIDPSLLQAVSDQSLAVSNGVPASYPDYTARATPPVPVYFRLSQASTAQGAPRLWLATIEDCTINGLLASALSFAGAQKFFVDKIEGLAAVAGGSDVMFQIDEDDELVAYLSHVGAGKATFVVTLR